jgi:hypothetical protein
VLLLVTDLFPSEETTAAAQYRWLLEHLPSVDAPPDPFDAEQQRRLLGPFNRPDQTLPLLNREKLDLRFLPLPTPRPAATELLDHLKPLTLASAPSQFLVLGHSGCGKVCLCLSVLFLAFTPSRRVALCIH